MQVSITIYVVRLMTSDKDYQRCRACDVGGTSRGWRHRQQQRSPAAGDPGQSGALIQLLSGHDSGDTGSGDRGAG